ncbi:type II toxin-antitoxin system RelE/ParE family toxin [uncultured Bacteroides sp.]|uniref:type II toxin-antitoxin system RelE/ParE family toxin n=1 Tax=uncultured Bacteroides sp. TaxID=162156 RepID=UPI00280B5784|nr:type II toxin-antitoxin system RelE/ParE family toxin [uncultured Bacteroides sp.]
MNYKIKVYRCFEKEVKKLSKRYKSLKQDLLALSAELLENPEKGVDLGNGLHKVRMSISSKGKGKSAGARIITLIVTLSDEEKEIGLHYIYDKSDRESLTDKELRNILKENGSV